MKSKYIVLSGVLLTICLSIVFMYNKNYSKEVTREDDVRKVEPLNGLAIMLETKGGSGIYNASTSGTFPESGYEFNSVRSGCENGGKLIWDEKTKSITLKTNLSDKCYIYFDVVPPDVSVAVNNLPTTYGKLGNITCDNSSTTYNQKYNRIEVSQINGKYTNCTLNYTDSTSKVNFADYIMSLAGTTQGTGQVINEKGYRYEGKNPNNYVWFNNEYWRIIGVFDSDTHGQSGKNLVKIVREDMLDTLAWDSAGKSNWKTATLNKLLNTSYYNAKDGTDSGNCGGYGSTCTAFCNYTKRGIQDNYRSMVANATWYLGGYTSNKDTAGNFYKYERGSSVYSGNPTSTSGYIGLMYPSDYGYSVLSSNCARTKTLFDYTSSVCAGASWLYVGDEEWYLTPRSDNDMAFLQDSRIAITGTFFGKFVRPTLYLEENVVKIDGDGSYDNPYIIGM